MKMIKGPLYDHEFIFIDGQLGPRLSHMEAKMAGHAQTFQDHLEVESLLWERHSAEIEAFEAMEFADTMEFPGDYHRQMAVWRLDQEFRKMIVHLREAELKKYTPSDEV